jgi:UDP-N-acetylglucosamine 2-epimerase (non-hydrolysing)
VLNEILDYFDIKPRYIFSVLQEGSSLARLSARLFQAIESFMLETSPDLVMVQGDTCTAWASAMVAFYHKVPVTHVEAGLRTWNKYSPFPEEVYRRQITELAEIHFTPTCMATDNLLQAGVSGVHQVGNTVVDSLNECLNREGDKVESLSQFGVDLQLNSNIVLVTCHRRENFAQMAEFASAINILAFQHPDLIFLIPLHMNPMVHREFGNNLDTAKNIVLLNPLPYPKFVLLLSKSYLVLTDSGGVLEEASSCHVPIMVLRENTERNEAVISGCAIMAGTTEKSIVETFNSIFFEVDKYHKMKASKSPFGNGDSSTKIVRVLEQESTLKCLSDFENLRSPTQAFLASLPSSQSP